MVDEIDSSGYAGGNLFLDSLDSGERGRLLEGSTHVALPIGEELFGPQETVSHLYFPVSGVISLVIGMSDGDIVEMATVGREGVAGIPMALESGAAARASGISQIEGAAYRVSASHFRQEVARGGRLALNVSRVNRALFALVSQNAACNRLHSASQRCARWLLMTHDRVGRDSYRLTHEFLSQMLGSRRATVTQVALDLQTAGAITYRRGDLTILDRDLLTSRACECYGVMHDLFDNLYGDSPNFSG